MSRMGMRAWVTEDRESMWQYNWRRTAGPSVICFLMGQRPNNTFMTLPAIALS
jgi:hypothetical protein